jgi:hypothetical protein
MKRLFHATLMASALGCLMSASSAHAVTLVNPGFELGADGPGATGWGGFNDNFTASDFAESGAKSLKVFGPFFQGGGAGAFQGGFPAAPGQLWQASSSIFSPSTDAINGTNFAITKLEFLDAGNTVIGFAESSQFNAATAPLDTWVQKTVQGVAPAGTTSAQIVLVHVQLNNPATGGAVFYDNASLVQIPEPATFALASLAISSVALIGRRRAKR